MKVTAGTAAVGAGGWGAAALAELLAGPAGHLIASAATPTAALVVIGAVRLAHRQRISEWSRSFRVASVGAVGWLATAATMGPGWWPLLGAALVGGAAVVSTPWRRAHAAPLQLPRAPERPVLEAAPEAPPLDQLSEFAEQWHRDVAHNPKLELAGCELTAGRSNGNVLEFTLQLVGGRTLSKVRAKQEEIASALGLDPMQLTFAHTPALPNGFRDTSKIATQVILSSPITKPVYFTGPRFTLSDDGQGLIDLGPCVDGQRVGRYELFRRSGMFSGVAIGSTGVGKSSVVNKLVVAARSCRELTRAVGVATLYLDPKGNSSPDLAKHATVTVLGLDRAEQFTACVEKMVAWLGKQSSADGKSVYTPDYRVAYLIVIDECDMLFALRGMADRWGTIAKTGRSYGVGLLLATQYAGMKAFGNSELLRSSIRAGNVILMRTESNTSDQLIAPDLPKSTTLPAKPGYLYLKNTSEVPGAIRDEWLLTSDEEIPPGFPEELRGWNADVALARYPDAPLCPIARRCLEPLLDDGDREERQQARAEQLRAEIDAFLRGDRTADTGMPAAVETLAGVEGLADRFAALPGPFADNVFPIRRNAVAAPADGRLTDADRLVLTAVQRGNTRSYQIVSATGLAGPRVSNIAKKLTGMGLLRDGGHGVWTLPGSEGVGA